MKKIAVSLRSIRGDVTLVADSAEWKLEHGPNGMPVSHLLIVKNNGSVVGEFSSDSVEGWWFVVGQSEKEVEAAA